MRRRKAFAPLALQVLGALLGLGLPVSADGAGLEVEILQPSPLHPVFGQVEIAAAVRSEHAVRWVVFTVDGQVVGQRTEPPYRVLADVGGGNREHRFEVTAEDASGAQVRAVVDTPALRVDLAVELGLQELYVTVNRGGERALDLGRGDFRVLDEGAEQEIVTFEPGGVPFTSLLLVDSSESMRGPRIDAALAGAERFVAGIRRLDQAKLLLFSDRVILSTPFTSFPEILTAGLSRVRPRGATALNDHLYMALKLLEGRSGREVVVLLSDGVDTASVLGMEDVLPLVRRSQAAIYWIRTGPGSASSVLTSLRGPEEHRREVELLERAVELSGGRIVPVRRIEEAPEAFAGVLTELREQYALGFYPSRRQGAGSRHRLRVEVRGRGLDVRAAEGYTEP